MEYMFYDCKSLKELIFPKLCGNSKIKMNNMFEGCDSLKDRNELENKIMNGSACIII